MDRRGSSADPRYRQLHNVTMFREGVLSRIRRIPGVLEAALSSAVPFRGTDFMHRLNRTGDKTPFNANGRAVDPSYFQILRIPLIRGRLFSAADVATSPPVMVVSESFATSSRSARTKHSGNTSMSMRPPRSSGSWATCAMSVWTKNPIPRSIAPTRSGIPCWTCVIARTAPNAPNPGAAIRQAIREVDPAQPAMNFTTIDRIISESVADRRFYTTATVAFASLALLLTVIGMTMVVARTVVERRKGFRDSDRARRNTGPAIRRDCQGRIRPVLCGTFVGLVAVTAQRPSWRPISLRHRRARALTFFVSIAVSLCRRRRSRRWSRRAACSTAPPVRCDRNEDPHLPIASPLAPCSSGVISVGASPPWTPIRSATPHVTCDSRPAMWRPPS